MTPRAVDLVSPTLASLRPNDPAAFALDWLARLGLHAAPVLAPDRRVLGIVTLGDLHGDLDGVRVEQRMTAPVAVVAADAPLDAVARAFALGAVHHLPVVTADGRAIGLLSALDVLRAWTDTHVPRVDLFDPRAAGVAFDAPAWLTETTVAALAEGPGAAVVTDPGTTPETLVWAGTAEDLRSALGALLAEPPAWVRARLHAGPLRVRRALP